MADFFRSIVDMQAPFNMIVLVVLIGCGAGIVCTVAGEIRKYMCERDELDLKREMLANGMSADEIERVVGAGPVRRS